MNGMSRSVDTHHARVGTSRRLQRGRRAFLAVLDLVINLIRHEPHFPFFTPVDELEEFGFFQHGSGGIAGRRDDESFDRFAVQGAVEELTRGLEVGGLSLIHI